VESHLRRNMTQYLTKRKSDVPLYHLLFPCSLSFTFLVFLVAYTPSCVESPLSTVFSTTPARPRLATTKRVQPMNPAASVHKAIVESEAVFCSLLRSFITACIPKHIPCDERSSRLRRHMSILKVRVRRAPHQVNLCRPPSIRPVVQIPCW
jgi:hypothetical protein